MPNMINELMSIWLLKNSRIDNDFWDNTPAGILGGLKIQKRLSRKSILEIEEYYLEKSERGSTDAR